MLTSVSPNSRRLVIVAYLVCLAQAIEAVLLGAGPEGSFVSNVLQMAAGASAGLLSLAAARRSSGLSRRFWTLVAVAFGIWSAGQTTYVYHENWLGVAVPQPSWTHFLFRLYGAPLMMALLIAPEDDESEGLDWLQILDVTQVGILFLFFYFDLYFVSGDEWRGLTALRLGGFFDFSDVENWSLALAFFARARISRRLDERVLSGRLVPYLLAYAASSTFYNYAYVFWGARTGEWPDLAFTFSLTIASVSLATWREESVGAPIGPGPGSAVHWAPGVVPLFTLGLALPMARHELTVAFVTVFASVACFGARLILTLYRRQRLMQALRASEERYANLLRLAPDAIFVHTGGRVTFANPATAHTLGVSSPEDLVGRHVSDFAPPEMRAEMAERLSRPDAATGPWVALRPDGTRVDLDAVGMTLDEAAPGAPASRLVIARDVTERHRAEAEREALIHELEAKNAELERFTYTVSHDLRSPLVTITGFLGYIQEGAARGDLDAVHSDIERIRHACRRMDRLLQDLLELSRVGHVLASPEIIPFGALAREAVEMVHGRLAKGGVKVDIEPDLPEVYGDRARLVEVLQNLLDNAAKFMGAQPSPRIWIGTRRKASETVFFVRDNGMGIESTYHNRVFGLFDKLDPKAEGTGVGLALVKRIVELHRGRVWVESLGAAEGATFCFTLPREGEASSRASEARS